MSIKKTFLAAMFLLLTAPAQAAIIQWDFFEVGDNKEPTYLTQTPQTISVAGYFDYDTTTQSLAARQDAFGYQVFYDGAFAETCSDQYACHLTLVDGLSGIDGSIGAALLDFQLAALHPLDGAFPVVSGTGSLYAAAPFGTTATGAFVLANADLPPVPTPLPDALPMFGTALLALAGFAARQSWRAGRG